MLAGFLFGFVLFVILGCALWLTLLVGVEFGVYWILVCVTV